ncbi:acyltransferase [Cobetia sp. D5]|uniref:acyltransferase n=1 Tax=Cobetia sp. D5 TaxID=3105867 RepID=UPI002D79802B|nr:acyltransferase [Cobetia sp. D5]
MNIENNVWIGHKVLIAGGNAEITIEENVDIAPCVTLVAGTHEKFTIEGRAAGRGYCLPIVIGKGSWIGANATILGGVTLGKCTLVAAGAMVTKNFPGNNIIAGVPARVIKIN